MRDQMKKNHETLSMDELERVTGGGVEMAVPAGDGCPCCGGMYRGEKDGSFAYLVCVLCGYRKIAGSLG